MNCPQCNGYMTSIKGKWYCKKCKDYTLDKPATVSPPPTQILPNVNFSDIAHVCPNCLKRLTSDGKYCMHCSSSYPDFDNSPQSISLRQQQIQMKIQMANLAAQQQQMAMQQQQMAIQQQQLQVQNAQYAAMLKCPKCGSTSISGNKKGYGVVKGGLGALALGSLTGGIGAVVGLGAGNIGRKKVQCTCMACGYKFKAGKA